MHKGTDNDDAAYGELGQLLRASRVDSFAPFFGDRVVNQLAPKLAASGAEALYDSLRWVFVRTSALGLVAAAILCLVNAIAFQDLGVVTTLVDTLFGLPSASLSDALSYGAL